MDGIINHTKRYYTQDEGDKKLDYGLHYVVSGLNLEYELDKLEPFFIEGLIVSVADEIAQSCSDFLDIVVSGFRSNEDFLNDKPFSNYANRYENTRRIAYHSCKDLVASVSNVFASFGWPLCDEGKEAIKTIIKNSQKTREETIKNNNDLGTFDEQAKKNVLSIYELYFKNPEMLELSSLKEFIFECEDEVQNKIVLNEVKEISKLFITKTDFLSEETTENQDGNAMSLSEEDLIKQKIIAFTKHCYERIVDESIGSNMKKAYQKCYKLFLREIAVTISMMTDSYAINKLEHQSD